ncbi:dipeptidyl peptidase like 10 [Homo sapiens]|uniref:Dipeptidyl peptidase like 10 n=1 Tax=Homo sapiens TaxID=9606 RepID=F8WEB2_HUMAN|nr:dipeptidyl peptidase like 10 [Homo sapiens]KAI4036009.1 dipeptidyl peptidase like 10 [Homo sapiens]
MRKVESRGEGGREMNSQIRQKPDCLWKTSLGKTLCFTIQRLGGSMIQMWCIKARMDMSLN